MEGFFPSIDAQDCPPPFVDGVVQTVCSTLYNCFYPILNPRYMLSQYLLNTRYEASRQATIVRTTFTNLPLTTPAPYPNHTHGAAAAGRSAVTFFIERLAADLGLQSYYYQRSLRDVKAGRLGSREYYWTRDINIPPTIIDPPNQCLLALVDVDHYVNMPRLLTRYIAPTIISTFQPGAVSRVAPEYSFTFDRDNRVEFTVTGGAVYQHHVWNYSNDHLKVVTYFNRINVCTAVSYLVDRRCSGPDHHCHAYSYWWLGKLFRHDLQSIYFWRQLNTIQCCHP